MSEEKLKPISKNAEDDPEILRHSTSHVLAQAVKRLFPDVKLGIGPAIKDGFYYDFDTEHRFTPEDLPGIEEEMHKISAENHRFERSELDKAVAKELFESLGEKYKLELIEEIEDERVTIYRDGEFTDLCRGPHVPSTSRLKVFKLLSTAGAYWRGDEKKPMLQRIYGTAFSSEKDLNQYLEFLEEAEKRDHRRLGKELDLYSMHEVAGGALVLYHPKGAVIRGLLEELERKEHTKRGYETVVTPHIYKVDVWKISGHYDYYKENMYFFEIDGQEYGIKPMNCPGHMLIYRSHTRSYRDLPLRLFELGTVYRHEISGVVHGLLRTRGFTQDDAHIFCLPEQLKPEIEGIIDFVDDVLKIFGFSYHLELSTRPENSIGTDDDWDKATQALAESLEEKGLHYDINEGEGAFYGPKVDVKLEDAIGRSWQCATIQVDFALPERFDLTYMGADNQHYRPVMVHRVILGSIERFLGVLIEHYAGAFPVWLSPVQAIILPIADRHVPYSENISKELINKGIRVEINSDRATVNHKIREAQLQKIPYMLVIGDREVENDTVAVRERSGLDRGPVKLDELIAEIEQKVEHYQ